MSWFSCRCAVVLAGLLWAGQSHASGGSLGVPPPPPAPLGETGSAFDGMRKPPIPVSFLSYEAGWIEFHYPPSARERVAPLIAQADDWRGELAEMLGQPPLDGVEVRVARGPEELATLAPSGAPAHAASSSAAYPKIKLIVLSLGSGAPLAVSELSDAFRRELARTALDQAVASATLPVWFVEGLAIQFGGEGEWLRAVRLDVAALRGKIVAISALRIDGEGAFATDLPTAEAADFMAFLARPEQHTKLARALAELRDRKPERDAILAGYGESIEQLERRWRADLDRRAALTALGCAVGIPASAALLWWAAGRIRRRARARSQASRAKERDGRRVHIVFSRRDERPEPLPMVPEAEIPKVEHEGAWHTLH